VLAIFRRSETPTTPTKPGRNDELSDQDASGDV
jgi:hypothetical protein